MVEDEPVATQERMSAKMATTLSVLQAIDLHSWKPSRDNATRENQRVDLARSVIKLIKRRGYGRSGLTLLRRCIPAT